MTSTFNDGTDNYVPILVDGFGSSSESQSIVRTLPFTGASAVVLRPGSLGSDTLRVQWATAAEAKDMRDALNAGVVWTFADTDHAALAMTFVVDGTARFEIDGGRSRWWTVFDYQEVAP